MARKPFKGNVANNVLEWGTGGINVDGCRVATNDKLGREFKVGGQTLGAGQYGVNDGRKTKPTNKLEGTYHDNTNGLGRFPANIIFDEEAGQLLDEQSGISKSGKPKGQGSKSGGIWSKSTGLPAGPEYGEGNGVPVLYQIRWSCRFNPSSIKYNACLILLPVLEPLTVWENMFIFSKGKPNTFNPILKRNKTAGDVRNRRRERDHQGNLQMNKKRIEIKEYGNDDNVWYISNHYNNSKVGTKYEHPAVMPDEICRRHITSWTNEDDLVYDPFLGSATTTRIAREMNRIFGFRTIHTILRSSRKNNEYMNIELKLGDCLEVLKTIEDNSIDSVVTDPPYHLTSIVKRFGKEDSAPAQFGTDGAYARASKGFMGKEWDGGDIAFRTDVWSECLRVLKPGGKLLAFSHSRTYHRMAVAVEDAGFEIRDQIMWVFGSGFPKSHNIGKAIDKMEMEHDYEGWGTALKPAHEPIVMARKPLSEKSIAENVLKHGTGGINIDGSRIGFNNENIDLNKKLPIQDGGTIYGGGKGFYRTEEITEYKEGGRFPANIIFDEEAGQLLDEQSGNRKGWSDQNHNSFNPYGGNALNDSETKRDGKHKGYNDNGGASRFFYCPKAAKKDRDEGLDNFEDKIKDRGVGRTCSVCNKFILSNSGPRCECGENRIENYGTTKNNHPTVKPVDLMRYLINLITPPNGTILDPFMGSGSTGKAAVRCGVNFIGIEKEQEYMDIAQARIEYEKNKPTQQKLF